MLSQSTHFSHYTGLVGRLSATVLIESNREKRCWYYLKVVSGLSSFLQRTGCDGVNRQMWEAEREWTWNQEARVQILLGHIFYVISHSYHYGSSVSSYVRWTQKYIAWHKIYRTPNKTRPVKYTCSNSSTKVWDHWIQSQSPWGSRIFQAN